MTRRNFIAHGAVSLGSLLATSRLIANNSAYGPFRMGLQSYSLHTLPFREAALCTKELGLHYLEAYNEHLAFTDSLAYLGAIRRWLEWHHLRVGAFGVIPFTGDTQRSRQIFEFAKIMGLFAISADPRPESFPALKELVHEFNIPIAIHPHGPGSRYPGWKAVHAAVSGKDRRIGICMDVGHVVRAGEDPVEGIRTFGQRVYGVHLKDLDATGQNAVVGTGVINIPDILRSLRQEKFRGILSLEYESEPPADPLPGIRQSLANIRNMMKKINH